LISNAVGNNLVPSSIDDAGSDDARVVVVSSKWAAPPAKWARSSVGNVGSDEARVL
jgi:hypothetical protein